MILTLFLVIAACFAVTYKHNFESKRPLLHVPDSETTRIAILDRSSRWSRVPDPLAPVEHTEPEGDGLDGLTVAQLKEIAKAEGVEGLPGWNKANWLDGIRSTRALGKAVTETIDNGSAGETMQKLAEKQDGGTPDTPKDVRNAELQPMKVGELIKIAATQGKTFAAIGTRKADVIEAILAAEFPE